MTTTAKNYLDLIGAKAVFQNDRVGQTARMRVNINDNNNANFTQKQTRPIVTELECRLQRMCVNFA